MKPRREYYRLVSDYGWGDKAWLERFMPASRAVVALSEHTGFDPGDYDTVEEAIEAALNYDGYEYSLEVDREGDTEDWDWMDS